MPNMVRPSDTFAPGSALSPVVDDTEAKRKYLQEIAAKKAYIQSLQTQDSDVPQVPDLSEVEKAEEFLRSHPAVRQDPKDFYPPAQKPEQLNPPTTGIGKVLRSRGMARRQKGPEGPFTSEESFRQQLGGVTWGTSDEMGVAAAALADTLRNGTDFAQNYEVIKGFMADRKRQYQEANPSRSAAEEMQGAVLSGGLVRKGVPAIAAKIPGLSKAAAAAKTALAPATKKVLDMAPDSARWLGRYIKQAAPVIAEAALYGYASGEGDERGESAAESAALGGLLKSGGDLALGAGKVLTKAVSGTKELFGRAGPAGPRIDKPLGIADAQIDRMVATRKMLGEDATRESVIKELGERGVDFTPINAATEAGTGLHTFYKQLVGGAYGGGDIRKQTAKSIAKLEEIVTKEELAVMRLVESGNLDELKAAGTVDNALHNERARLNGLKAEDLDQEIGRFNMAAQDRAEALKASTSEVEIGMGRERARLEQGDLAGRAQEEARLGPLIDKSEAGFEPQIKEIEFGAQTQSQQIEREQADMMSRLDYEFAPEKAKVESKFSLGQEGVSREHAKEVASLGGKLTQQKSEIESGFTTQQAQIKREHADEIARLERGTSEKMAAAQSEADAEGVMMDHEQASALLGRRNEVRQANASQVAGIDDDFRRKAFMKGVPPGADDDVIEQLKVLPPRESNELLDSTWSEVGWPEVKGQSHEIAPDTLIAEVLSELQGRQDDSAEAIASAITKRLKVPEGSPPGAVYTYTGDELMDTRNALRAAVGSRSRDNPASEIAKSAVAKGADKIEEKLRSQMTGGQKTDFGERLSTYGYRRNSQRAMDDSLERAGVFDQKEWLRARKMMHTKTLRGGKDPVQVVADEGIARKAELKELLAAELEQVGLSHKADAPLLRKTLGREHASVQSGIQKDAAREAAGLKSRDDQARIELTDAKRAFLEGIDFDTSELTAKAKAAAEKASKGLTATRKAELLPLTKAETAKAAELKSVAEGERKQLTEASKSFLKAMDEDKTKLTKSLKAKADKSIAAIDEDAARRAPVLATLEADEIAELKRRAKVGEGLGKTKHNAALKAIETKYSDLKSRANTKAKHAKTALKTKGKPPSATTTQKALAKAKASLPPDSVGSRVLATSLLGIPGGIPAWALGMEAGTAATLVSGALTARTLSQQGSQSFVAGQLPAQRQLAELLREYELSQAPEMLMQLRRPIERVAAEHLKR